MENKSYVWRYFEKKGDKAKCSKCPNKFIKLNGGSTSSLIYHLKKIHGIDSGNSINLNLKTEGNTIGKYLLKESVAEILSKCIIWKISYND